jgi:hypothetical protein
MGDDRAAAHRASTAPTGRARTLVWTLLTAITIALATGLLQASWLAWRLELPDFRGESVGSSTQSHDFDHACEPPQTARG